MKPVSLLIAVLLECVVVNCHAEGFFVGGEVAPLVFWNECDYVILCSSGNNGRNEGHTSGFGVYAGKWLSREGKGMMGLEVGYDRLGSKTGSEQTDVSSGGFILPSVQRVTMTWKHEPTIVHGELIAGGKSSDEADSSAMLGKIGLYSASVKTEGSVGYGPGGGAYSRTITSNGLFLGIGYLVPIASHLSARLGADIFVNVKVANPVNTADTVTEHFVKLSLGLDFDF